MSDRKDRLERFALAGFFRLCRAVPMGTALWMADRLGDLLFGLIRIRRTVTLDNLRASFPEKEEPELRAIARRCYRGFARTAVEFARLPGMDRRELLQRVELDPLSRERIERLRRMERGAILLTGHYGNWEWVGALFPAIGLPARVVVGRQRNREVEALMDRVRESCGLRVLNVEEDVREMIQALRRKEWIAIVADQDAGRDGIFIDFLGRPASTALGPVRLARRFGVPILVGMGLHLPGGKVRLQLEEPTIVPQDGDEEATIRRYTEWWSGLLERYVRERPDHWFWMHRRWKTQPGPAAGRKGG
ncbi:MAG: hypothetical protein GF346_07475 [Candidatus Eisenbacteria bacterium]|nr:hypothetical protein [Candidatus Latescibacterota bacterium]MBD3302272.1 hypothetical protein [Candidatus Eisenbacteria bacterium]